MGPLSRWSLSWGPGGFWKAWLVSDETVFVLQVVVVVLSIRGLCSEVLLGGPVRIGGLIIMLLVMEVVISLGSCTSGEHR